MQRSFILNLLRGVMLLCGLAWATACWSLLAWTPVVDWNSARLYPSFLLASGISPYGTPGEGVIVGWIYGPIMPLVYLPVVLGPTLTSAVVIAAILNLLVLVGPMVFIFRAVAQRLKLSGWEQAALILVAGGGWALFPVLRNYLRVVMADQVTVALTLLSCWLLARARYDRLRFAAGGALLAVLAVWTKQIAVAVPLAQLAYLVFVRRDYPAARHYFIALLAWGAAVTGVMIAVFGMEPLVFNLWIVPSGHPMKPLGTLSGSAWLLLVQAVPCLLVAWGLKKVADKTAALPDHGLLRELLALLVTVAVIQLPLNLMGASKVGGGLNSFHAVALLFVVGMLALAGTASWWRSWTTPTKLALIGSGGALAGAFLLAREVPLRLWPAPQLEAARLVAAQYPGQIYIPDNPLITWWNEKRADHFEDALISQAMAGFPTSKERYFGHLPPTPRYVLYPAGRMGPALLLIPGLRKIATFGTHELYAKPAEPVKPRP